MSPLHNDPTDPKACHGCKNLRYAPATPIDHDDVPVSLVAGFGSPGEYRCNVYGILCGADCQPQPRTPTCKETY